MFSGMKAPVMYRLDLTVMVNDRSPRSVGGGKSAFMSHFSLGVSATCLASLKYNKGVAYI